MIKYEIREPMWNGKCVGISSHRLRADTIMEITISYKDSEGNLIFPFKYRMPTKKMRTYQTQTLSSGVVLHIIPIEDFEVVKEGYGNNEAWQFI